MTPAPRVVDALEDTFTARALMNHFGIRHLPVVKDGELFGILSERDIRQIRAYLDPNPGEVGPPVSEVCSRELVVVPLDTPVGEAAELIATRRVGSALVVEGTKLRGIVTTVDLCRALGRLVSQFQERALIDRP